MVHNLEHTILRGNTYYYNRRVPKYCIAAFGQSVVEAKLSKDFNQARELSEHLSTKLTELWNSNDIQPVDISRLLVSTQPRTFDLLGCTKLYLEAIDICERPVYLAIKTLVSLSGNKDVSLYDRADARAFVQALLEKGNKTATVRRRIQSIHAVLEFRYLEKDELKRNPFSRLPIADEGKDASKRGVFTPEQL